MKQQYNLVNINKAVQVKNTRSLLTTELPFLLHSLTFCQKEVVRWFYNFACDPNAQKDAYYIWATKSQPRSFLHPIFQISDDPCLCFTFSKCTRQLWKHFHNHQNIEMGPQIEIKCIRSYIKTDWFLVKTGSRWWWW